MPFPYRPNLCRRKWLSALWRRRMAAEVPIRVQGLPKRYPRDTQGNNRLSTPEQHRSNTLTTGSQEACITPGPKQSCPCNEKLPRCPRDELADSTLGTVLP